MDRFSEKCTILDINEYPNLASAHQTLANLACNKEVELIQLQNDDIAFRCALPVSVGTRSKIKREEPIVIIVHNTDDIESICPDVFPDRIDFPFDQLPHVNYPYGGFPPTLCISRENSNEWYSGISFRQYILTIIQWFNDAANHNLIKSNSGDEFEPHRFDGSTTLYLFRASRDDVNLSHADKSGTILFDIKQKDTAYVGQNTSPNFTQDGIGITLYRNHKDYSFEWFANLPTTWGELMNFINQERLNLNLEKLIEILQSHTNLKHIFVECAIPRPTNIVGKEDNLERLCFYISKEDLLSGKENAPIMYVRIYDFLTQTKAAQISNTPPSLTKKKILILGCGAVGSKLLAHLYRSGICNITICDNDLFEAHNVVRHILFDSSKTLQYKVKLIKEILDTMYVGPTNIQSINEDAVFFIRNANLDKFDLIIDTTASNRVMYALDEVKTQCPIFRFALANRGSIGLQYVKAGEHTSLKDFYATIMQKYILEEDTESLEYKSLEAWFSPRCENDFDDIRTGESCRSITMKISDELISYHTSLAAIKVKQILSQKSLKDTISLSFIEERTQDANTITFQVPQWKSLPVKEGWNLKMTHNLFVQFGKMTAEYKSIENGGYLIGYCDEKHKLIYLIGHYEPSDTVHKPDEVSLGVSGWSEYLTKMQKLTGDKIRYLGDWHSHPRGTTTCSAKDQMMFEKLRREIKDVGVCLITTRIQIKPYPLNIGG